ncbi:MAG: hypothetical protein ACR2LD_06085 [Actinomycetota bacterium]
MKRQFERAADRVEAPPTDYESVFRGGRSRLWRARASAVLLSGALAAAGFSLLSLPEDAADESSERVQSAAQETATVPAPRVATFAVRAVAQAGVLNPAGDFSDYKSVESIQNGWVANFDAFICGTATCDPNPGGNSQLTIEVRGDTLVVTEASGPIGDDALQSLLSYREQVTSEEVGLQFPFLRIGGSPDEGTSILASPLWTGPIPASGVQMECHLSVKDNDGVVVFERTLVEPLPQREEMRAGTKFILGIPGDLAQEASNAELVCDTTTQ